jgi:phosphoribosylanthranilate isomerase
MFRFSIPIIQAAGVKSAKEAELMAACGFKYLGFPLRLDRHAEDISDAEVREINLRYPNIYSPVLITYLENGLDIVKLCTFTQCKIVQIHGNIELEELQKVKRAGIDVIKSLVIADNNTKEIFYQLSLFDKMVDAFITDTYDPSTGASGATGKVHDWDISRRIVEKTKTPIILAGGLNPDNVIDAIRYVKPAGVDTHTGIEDENGNKSEELMREFVLSAEYGFREIF